ncbi:HxlR family transcriptional regulator [Promicromonospora sp. AC04]|nr:HxlR family transcriptional regulator [Promicromonospora sp. AC04]
MGMTLTGALEDRSTWSATGWCPVEKAVEIIGSRPAMLIMREAFYGTTRFDDFVERVGVAPATAASHLRTLVAAGLLERHVYQEPGARRREEYRLTDAGTDLLPVVLGLFQWGRKHTSTNPPISFTHTGCDEPVGVAVQCDAGHRVGLAEITATTVLPSVREPVPPPEHSAPAPRPRPASAG